MTLLTTVAALTPVEVEFENWLLKWEKSYANAIEHRYRFSVFSQNYAEVEYRNSLNRTFTLGINKFADLTNDEFRARFTSMRKAPLQHKNEYSKLFRYEDLPVEVDWTQKGAVTPVKNQGQCGSCWAFSTTGSIEGAWFLSTGDLVSLSEQQLVDCSGPQGNQGCNGGLMDQGFEYVIQNGGICSEGDYPYQAQDGNCTKCTPVAKIHSYVDVLQNNETALMGAVAQQPVSVAVEADGLDWQLYFGGIVTDSCGTNLDHGVLVVGYGTQETTQPQSYWKVKNSWGADWGEEGYIRLGRGSQFAPHGECGILMQPSYPVV
jgi:C1A family cysteine protease